MTLPSKLSIRRDQMRVADLGTVLGGLPLVLVGLPGVGKTSVGRRMAEIAKLSFFDADEEIEAAMDGMSIADFIARHGEKRFRDVEHTVVLAMLGQAQVLALGEGAFSSPATREVVSRRAVSIWLQALPAMILKRIDPASRPLLAAAGDPAAELERLALSRAADYACADVAYRVAHEDLHDTVCNAYLELLKTVQRQPDPDWSTARVLM